MTGADPLLRERKCSDDLEIRCASIESYLGIRTRIGRQNGWKDFSKEFQKALAEGFDAAPGHVNSTGLPVATLNVALAVLGAGQLTLPFAMAQLGLAWGCLEFTSVA